VSGKYRASEIRDGEVFLHNTQADSFPRDTELPFKTLRLGGTALDIDGRELPDHYGIRPVFIHRSEEEAYNAMREREFSKNYRNHR
jgi:hypothetical protein